MAFKSLLSSSNTKLQKNKLFGTNQLAKSQGSCLKLGESQHSSHGSQGKGKFTTSTATALKQTDLFPALNIQAVMQRPLATLLRCAALKESEHRSLKRTVFSQKGECFWKKRLPFTFPLPYFSSVAKQCHVTHVQAASPKANIPSYTSLIAQPPCAAPKPTFLAFQGLAFSSLVPFHISPGRDDSFCPRTAPPVSHSSREAVPKGRLEPGPRERHLPAHVLEQSGGSTISLSPLQNTLAADKSLSKDQGVCHHHLLS